MRSSPTALRKRNGILRAAALALATAAWGCGDDGPTGPDREGTVFRVRVASEEFRMRVTDPETIRLARENLAGGNSRHPNGPIAPGDGGFNSPWSWHHLPGAVRMVDFSIELCDGAPGYVETHRNDYLAVGYCPWGARIVAEE